MDDEGRLEGVVSFRDLVFSRPGVGLEEVMVRDPDRGPVRRRSRRGQRSDPAVPPAGDTRLLTETACSWAWCPTTSVIESIQEEASEDFAAAMGAGVTESVRTSVSKSVRARLPWIAFDVVISTSVVWAVSQFNDVLDEFVVLAALMPLVARIGGDAGAQSLAVVIRGLAADEIPMSGTSRVVIREATIGAINGVAIAVLAGILGFVMQELQRRPESAPDRAVDGHRRPGQPGDSRRRRLRDPAASSEGSVSTLPSGSNLFLTTVTDLMGFAGFLAVATLLLR